MASLSDAASLPRPADEARAATPGRERVALLDGVRALAVASVVVCHTASRSGHNVDGALGELTARLNVGVAVFFVLSGFLLFRPFAAAALLGAPRVDLRRYARRRTARIVPAYWLWLTVLGVAFALEGFPEQAPALYAFAQVYRLETVFAGLYPAWSLDTEVAFYLLLPLLAGGFAALVVRAPSPDVAWRRGLAALGALSVATLVLRAVVFRFGGPAWLNLTVVGLFDWFALGMGLALASVALAGRPTPPSAVAWVADRPGVPWAAAAALFVLCAYALALPPEWFLPGRSTLTDLLEHVLFGAIATLVVLPAVLGPDDGGLARRLLAARPVAALGVVSYGVFLIHAPITDELLERGVDGFAALTAGTFAVTVPLAVASWLLLERPILRRA